MGGRKLGSFANCLSCSANGANCSILWLQYKNQESNVILAKYCINCNLINLAKLYPFSCTIHCLLLDHAIYIFEILKACLNYIMETELGRVSMCYFQRVRAKCFVCYKNRASSVHLHISLPPMFGKKINS